MIGKVFRLDKWVYQVVRKEGELWLATPISSDGSQPIRCSYPVVEECILSGEIKTLFQLINHGSLLGYTIRITDSVFEHSHVWSALYGLSKEQKETAGHLRDWYVGSAFWKRDCLITYLRANGFQQVERLPE